MKDEIKMATGLGTITSTRPFWVKYGYWVEHGIKFVLIGVE